MTRSDGDVVDRHTADRREDSLADQRDAMDAGGQTNEDGVPDAMAVLHRVAVLRPMQVLRDDADDEVGIAREDDQCKRQTLAGRVEEAGEYLGRVARPGGSGKIEEVALICEFQQH